MTTIDPTVLIRTGRACVAEAANVDAAAAGIDLGLTSVPDGRARHALIARTERLGARLRHNGRELERVAQQYRELDSDVSLSYLMLTSREWR